MAFSKTMAGVGDLRRICTDAFFVAGAVQEASSAENCWIDRKIDS